MTVRLCPDLPLNRLALIARLRRRPVFLSSTRAEGDNFPPSRTPTTNAPVDANPGPEKTIFMDDPFYGFQADR